jgi:putative hydrolase of the HAD superfamily
MIPFSSTRLNVSKWQAIVFDLDDTLYPEKAYVLSGFQAVARWAAEHLGIPTGQGLAELKRLFERGVRGDTFNRWLAEHNLASDSVVPQLVQVYREHKPALAPFPKVPGLLESLRQRYRLGLISDGHLAVQRRKLAALDLARHFDAIVFSDEWGREAWKPSIKPFKIMLQRLGVKASQTVYAADNPLKDFWGARQVGISTIWIRWPGGEYTHLDPPTSRHAADLIIDSLNGFEQVLIELEEVS